jgi:hypothetical protein
MGLDTHKRLTEMHEDGYVENTVGIHIEVLDVLVPEHALEEVTSGRASPRSANRANMGISSGFFSIGYGLPVAACHRSISFSRRNPLLTKASRSSVFNFSFFHSLAGLGRGVDGGDDSRAEPSASLRVLFFPVLASYSWTGCLHPPSNGCLHSHSLEGYTGGGPRRRV